MRRLTTAAITALATFLLSAPTFAEFAGGALVLLGLWLVVRSHTDATTPAT